MSRKALKKRNEEIQEQARLARAAKRESPEYKKLRARAKMKSKLIAAAKKEALSRRKRFTAAGLESLNAQIEKDLDEAGY